LSKKILILIICLTALALIGTLGMQLYWIGLGIDIAEKQFNKTVAESLDHVAERLVLDDVQRTKQELSAVIEPSGSVKDDFEKEIELIEQIKVWQVKNPIPIEERVMPHHLDDYLKQELSSHGITEKIEYGVFSNAERAFVIKDNHFLVLDSKEKQEAQEPFQQLYTSPHKVYLFRDDMESPGVLMVFFPEYSSLRWRQMIPALLSTLLFLTILVASSGYSFWAVLRQKKLSEMKNDFINNMTHEFKTPIATIALASDSVLMPVVYENPEKLKRFISIIQQENRRMNSQVEKVLQMAQVEKQDFQVRFESVNMHDIITLLINNFTMVVEQRGGQLTFQNDATKHQVFGDVTHLTNAVNNLLDNANKYSPDTPIITLKTYNRGGSLVIAVSDNGRGISRENQVYIFDKFYRVHTGNLHDVKGFGLGLSYVKEIALLHKGKVSVASELGRGSTFEIWLPVE
jgi:two-component system, OmpR family, phosphate regulon sensor histidine kinase PhoR